MRIPLNHDWSFAPFRQNLATKEPLKGATKVTLPHATTLTSAQYLNELDYQNEYTYQLVFDCKDDAPVKLLHFDGVMLQFDCYLNGYPLGHFISGYLPVTVDVSDYMLPKGNILTVFVDGREDPMIPPFGKVVDYLTFSGIYREVYLTTHPKAYIRNLHVEAKADGRIDVAMDTVGKEKHAFTIYDGQRAVAEFNTFSYTLPCPRVWTLKDPFLYTFEARYGDDVKRIRIGFRDVEWTVDGFLLNGRRLPLVGLNRHQTFPYFGPAAPKSLQEEDADLLKATGINVVRTSHYPQSEHFLSRCDEIGLFVIDEIPGWQFIGTDAKWRQNCIDFAQRMILKERNHPCLIAYGLRIDESRDDDELYQQILAVKDKLDPHRASLGVRNFKDSHCLEDIYAYNDFSCEDGHQGVESSKEVKGGKGKPILITESNGHLFPTKPFDTAQRRVEHALRHARVLNDALDDRGYCGALTWCAFDYNTHQDFGSGDHVCHHGVYDMFRNPKYAASFFQSQGRSPMLEVASLLAPGDFDAARLPCIVVFTSGDHVDAYRGNQRIGSFYPDRKSYPRLPHPPIFIDDFIGETFQEPGINEEDAKRFVALFNYCAQFGFQSMRITHKISLARLSKKYKLSDGDIRHLYGKYVQSWGEGGALWRFDAYQGEQKIASLTRGPSTNFHLEVRPTREELIHGETYDCLSVHITMKDQYGTRMPYASEPVIVKTEGPIEIYGPSVFSLYGGASTVYVRSLPAKGPQEGVLKLTALGETLEYRFLVKQQID